MQYAEVAVINCQYDSLGFCVVTLYYVKMYPQPPTLDDNSDGNIRAQSEESEL